MANRAGGKEVERRKEMEGSAHESSNEPNLYERARSQSHPLTPPNTVFLLLPYISTVYLPFPDTRPSKSIANPWFAASSPLPWNPATYGKSSARI